MKTLIPIQNQQKIEIIFKKLDNIQFKQGFLFLNDANDMKAIQINQQNSLEISQTAFCNCQSIQIQQIISLSKGIFSQNILIKLYQTNNLVLIGKQSCTVKQTTLIPLKSQIQTFNNQDYFIIQFSSSIQVFNNQLLFLSQIDFSSQQLQVVDFIAQQIYQPQNYLTKVFLLKNDSTLTLLNITFNQDSTINFQNNSQIIQILISKPQFLFIFDEISDQNNNTISAKRLFVANQEAQSFLLYQNNLMLPASQEKSNYTVSSFQLKQKTKKRIVNLLPLENIMMLVGCSKDGQLIAWYISNVFQDQYLYSIQLSQDSCIELIQYNVTNHSDIIAVFSKTIFLIDVIRLKKKHQWQQQNLKIKYSVNDNNNNVVILIDQNFTYFISNYKNQIFLNFNGLINDIQNITFQQGKYLVVQRNNSIDLYGIASNQLNKISSYSLSSKLLFLKIRDLSQSPQLQSSFEICLFTADQQFILMRQNFIPYQKIKRIPLSTVQDIQFINSDPNDPQYFMIGKNNKSISTYPFSLYTVQRSSQQIILVSKYTYASQFIEPNKYYDSYNNPIYDLKVLSNKGSMSTLTSNRYDPTRNRILLEQQQNILGKTGIKFTVRINKKILFGKNYYIIGIEILNLQHSQTKSKYFITTNNILVFNIHTREFIETIQIDKAQNPVNQFQTIKQQLNQIVATKQNILYTKNYDTNNTYLISSTQPFSQFALSVMKYHPSIIIAGDQIMKLNLNLTINFTLQYPTNSLVLNIFFATPTKIIFQFQNSQIFIADYITFSVIQQILPIHLKNNYQIQYDSNMNYIYLYSNYQVEIFSINGTQIDAIQKLGQVINKIQICNNYTLLITSNQIGIYSVNDFSQMDNYNFQGGNIQKILFISDFNHLVIFGDTIEYGQIFVQSLLQLQQIQIFTNPYSYNNPSLIVDIFYDQFMTYQRWKVLKKKKRSIYY
ncbi:hypothetical protein ABPG72_020211 [Tetrahymena utriculariae]